MCSASSWPRMLITARSVIFVSTASSRTVIVGARAIAPSIIKWLVKNPQVPMRRARSAALGARRLRLAARPSGEIEIKRAHDGFRTAALYGATPSVSADQPFVADDVRVAAAVAVALDQPLVVEVAEDRQRRSLCQPDARGDRSHGRFRMLRDEDQHDGVIREEAPRRAWCARRRSASARLAASAVTSGPHSLTPVDDSAGTRSPASRCPFAATSTSCGGISHVSNVQPRNWRNASKVDGVGVAPARSAPSR